MSSPYDSLDPVALRARRTAKWNTFEPDVLAFWVAEMDFPTDPVVLQAVRDAVEREEFGYTDPATLVALGEAVASFSRDRYGWSVDPERVHVLPDVLRGVELGIDHFTPPDAPIIIPTPAYMPFFAVPSVVRRPAVEVPTRTAAGRAVLDLGAIEAAFAAGAGSIILCNPYNPLGRSFDAAELRALAEIVDRHGGRVVSDEIHAPLTYRRDHVPYASVSELAASHSVTAVSASKAWNLPGLKCAALITTCDADEAHWGRLPSLATQGASPLGIEASIAAFSDGEPWLDETLRYLDGNRHLLGDLLHELLPEVGYVPPEATYLAWLDFSGLGLPTEPAEYFLERARVAMNPGPAFGSNGVGCARFNFGTSAELVERGIGAIAIAARSGARRG